MSDTATIGRSGMLPYGARVDACHIEQYAGADPAVWLTRLARALIQAAVSAEGLQYLVPEVTDRIRTEDGGVDASLRVELPLPHPRTAGLVNPGRTIYQFKWRANRSDIVQAAKGELKKLQDGDGLPDYYVFVTNIDLTTTQHRQIKAKLREDCKRFCAARIVLLGASELADRVNNDPRLRVTLFDVALGLCTLESAKVFAERRYDRDENIPTLFDRQEAIAVLTKFISAPESRVVVIHGPQGAGKTRLVVEALAPMPERVVWARDVID